MVISLVPRPCPTFCCLQYRKLVAFAHRESLGTRLIGLNDQCCMWLCVHTVICYIAPCMKGPVVSCPQTGVDIVAPDLNCFVPGLHQFGSYLCTGDSDSPGMHEVSYILCRS